MVDKNAAELLLKIRDLTNEYLQSQDKNASKETNKEIETDGVLDQLPWKQYPSGIGSWILATIPDAEQLVLRLVESNGKVQIGKYVYQFSGKGRFISRHEVKG